MFYLENNGPKLRLVKSLYAANGFKFHWYGFSFTRRHDAEGARLWGNDITILKMGIFKVEWVVTKGPIKAFVRWTGFSF